MPKTTQIQSFLAIMKSTIKKAENTRAIAKKVSASGKQKKPQHTVIKIENPKPIRNGTKELTRVLISMPNFFASVSKTKCVNAT